MSQIPDGLYYSSEHEWVKIEGDNATIGITDHAQDLLTDIVFVELPDPGKAMSAGDSACVVESVKSVSDVYSPIAGEISEVNSELENAPELVNEDPYGGGWMFKLTGVNADDASKLMDAAGYKTFIENSDH